MSFLTEYFRRTIEAHMEDPEEREKAWEARLRHAVDQAAVVKKNLTYPTKSWGFWRSDLYSATYETNADPSMKKMPGRGRPEY